MKKLLFGLVATSALSTLSAAYQKEGDFYFDIGVGTSQGPSGIWVARGFKGGGGYTAPSAASPTFNLMEGARFASKFQLGWNALNWLGLEANVTYWGKTLVTNSENATSTMAPASFTGNFWSLSSGGNLVVRRSFLHSRLSFFGKAGLACQFSKITIKDPGDFLFTNAGTFHTLQYVPAFTWGFGGDSLLGNTGLSLGVHVDGITNLGNHIIRGVGYYMTTFSFSYAFGGY